jgi:general secretion pathway protein K
MALLYVLWACALFALLAGSFIDASHTALAGARGRAASAEAQALADGALALGLLSILESDPARVAIGPRTLELPSGRAVLSIEDEGGKVDLNRAPAPLLEALFRAAGAAEAGGLAAAVLAERARLAPLGRPGFVLPDLLGRLPGIPTELLTRLWPAVTTLSQAEVIDPGVAGPLALAAATGLPPDSVASFLAARPLQGRFARPPGAPDAAKTGPLTGAGFTLLARAEAGNASAARLLLLRPAPIGERLGGRLGVVVIDWRTPRTPPW